VTTVVRSSRVIVVVGVLERGCWLLALTWLSSGTLGVPGGVVEAEIISDGSSAVGVVDLLDRDLDGEPAEWSKSTFMRDQKLQLEGHPSPKH
jgi:hypothetical protein